MKGALQSGKVVAESDKEVQIRNDGWWTNINIRMESEPYIGSKLHLKTILLLFAVK